MKEINIECKNCRYIDWNNIEYHKHKQGFVRFGCLAENNDGKTPWISTLDNSENMVVCKDYIRELNE